jgi:dTDP-4-dehydrorhamnose reductase
MSVLLLGHGYIAHALAKEMASRGIEFRDNKVQASHLNFNLLMGMLHKPHTDLVINAAAFIPSPTVDACKDNPEQNILGNVLLPATLAHACRQCDVPLMHISTGCLFDEQREYTEQDTPTRGWDGYCGAYVGAKLLAEQAALENPESFVLRIRLPFDETDHPRNYLSKLGSFPTVFDHWNSLTHRGDFAKAALDLWQNEAAYGIYHCVNPGQVSARQVVLAMMEESVIARCPEFNESPPSTGCRLSTAKLEAAGVRMRHVDEAIADSLRNWRKK